MYKTGKSNGNAQKYVYACPLRCANRLIAVDFMDESGLKSGDIVQCIKIEHN